jgi:ABC-2 type transport system ATP-binding protein
MGKMIKIENLVKCYGQVRALDGLSLNVEPGVVYGFLGPNGAGKTTTLRILAGLARPDQGRAWILGKEVSQTGSAARTQIGVLPEEPAFYPWMTASEYLRDFIAPLFGIRATAARQRTKELLEIVGLKEAAKRRVGGFSRGMRQRLGLAQALIHNPPLLLLDEPVSALDPAGRKEVLDLIEGLRGKTTILLSTHILADVERVCDMVGIVSKGRLIVQDRREDLLARYTMPIFEIEVEDGFGTWSEQVRQLPVVENLVLEGNIARVLVKDIRGAQRSLLDLLATNDLLVRRFEVLHPSLEDVFLRLTVQGG